MKKFTLLFLLMLLGITGVDAKSRTTTLWEGTDTGADIEVAMSNLVKGATLNLTFNWLGSDGAQFSCFWWDSSTSAWVKIKNCQWVGNGNSYSFTLTDDEFDAITSDKLCFKTEDKTKLLITKIEQAETLIPTSIGNNLLSGDWVVAVDGWENRNFAAQTTAKIGDVIQIEITVASGWKYTEVEVKDSEGSNLENTSKYVGNFAEETSETFEFEINNINDLEKIQSTGFRINASNHATIRSIKLLSYKDSYDAVSVTIGPDEVATFSSAKDLDFTASGLSVYYASAVTTGSVTLTKVENNTTWNYQGYILKGDAGTYTIPVTASATWQDQNYLKGHVGDALVYRSAYSTYEGEGEEADKIRTCYRYIFAKDKSDGTIAFFKLISDYTLAAHRAYLETETDIKPVTEARVVLKFEDDPTAIGEVKSAAQPAKADNVYYNLNGQRVEKPTKGIYILNGKKVLF